MTDKTKTTDSNIRAQMRKGILEYCVLLLLSRQRAYPSDIINGLSEASLIVVEGTLYTLLNRLRKEGKRVRKVPPGNIISSPTSGKTLSKRCRKHGTRLWQT